MLHKIDDVHLKSDHMNDGITYISFFRKVLNGKKNGFLYCNTGFIGRNGKDLLFTYHYGKYSGQLIFIYTENIERIQLQANFF